MASLGGSGVARGRCVWGGRSIEKMARDWIGIER